MEELEIVPCMKVSLTIHLHLTKTKHNKQTNKEIKKQNINLHSLAIN